MDFILGTRGSDLARAQTDLVIAELQRLFPEDVCSQKIVRTLGDSKQGTPRAEHGDKRDWIQELEEALIAGDIDLAVHSGKDVPVDIEQNTVLLPVLERSFPLDVFIGKKQKDGTRIQFSDLNPNSVVGTASRRRGAQLMKKFPGITVVSHRGNINTRLQKLEESDTLSGIILARAGLERLELFAEDMEEIAPEDMLPAVNQGLLVVQLRMSDSSLFERVQSLCQPEVDACFNAERACIQMLDADCHSAVSAYAVPGPESTLLLRAEVYSQDGTETVAASATVPFHDAATAGREAGTRLLQQGAARLLDEARAISR